MPRIIFNLPPMENDWDARGRGILTRALGAARGDPTLLMTAAIERASATTAPEHDALKNVESRVKDLPLATELSNWYEGE